MNITKRWIRGSLSSMGALEFRYLLLKGKISAQAERSAKEVVLIEGFAHAFKIKRHEVAKIDFGK